MTRFIFLMILVGAVAYADRPLDDGHPGYYEACAIDFVAYCEKEFPKEAKKNGRELCRALDNRSVILREAQFKNGILDGPFTCRDFGGQILIQTTFKNGQLNGVFRQFGDHSYQNPNPKADWSEKIKKSWVIKHYVNGLREGLTLYLDSKENLIEVDPKCYHKGKAAPEFIPLCLNQDYGKNNQKIRPLLNEIAKKHYAELNRTILEKYKDGKIRLKAQLVDGQYDGSYQEFYPNGKISIDAIYKKKELVSRLLYFESGVLQAKEVYKNGLLVEKDEFYENKRKSKSIVSTHSNNESIDQVKEYYESGQLYMKYTSIKHEFSYWPIYDGEVELRNSDGVVIYLMRYKRGQLDGVSQFFDYRYNSQRRDALYVKGRLTEEQIFDSKGTLLEKIDYNSDGTVKKKVRYLEKI